jgi:stage IV sporulation protein A
MEQAVYDVYRDISARTGGEIYIGVVGPVRTGKSTFIKRFMELFVLPNMEETDQNQARDELPQSAAGRMIMTTEPKFIPKEAAKISTADGTEAKVRLIDCVGYMVEGATGHEEDDLPRMVKTPWSDEEIPFAQAAEIGTEKVIRDHSTIGIVMMGDGSFGELTPEQFMPALEKTIRELKSIGKPFIVVLNCQKPYDPQTRQLADQISNNYGVTVQCVNAAQLRTEDVSSILSAALAEFPISQMDFGIPKWVELLKNDHPLKREVIDGAKQIFEQCSFLKDLSAIHLPEGAKNIERMSVTHVDAATGHVQMEIALKQESYYQTISAFSGMEITSEAQLLTTFFTMSSKYLEYEQVEAAMERVRGTGYGVVTPTQQEITLSEPELIKQSGKFGVKMRASAPSIHMIRTNIETEIAPIVGNEEQARDLINYIKAAANAGEGAVWSTNIFGKTIAQIVEDGMYAKINQMTQECQQKLQDAMAKIINDSNGGMVCIII